MKKILIMSLFFACPLLATNNDNFPKEEKFESSTGQIIKTLSKSSVEELQVIINIVTKFSYTPLTPEKLLQKFKKNTGHDSRFYPLKALDIRFEGVHVYNEYSDHVAMRQEFFALEKFLSINGMGDSTLKAQHNRGVFELHRLQGDVEKAKILLLKCATSGLVKSMYLLGTDDKFKNDKEIDQATWLLKAAEKDYSKALIILAQQFQKTETEKYTSYFKQAIEAGWGSDCYEIKCFLENHPQITEQINWVRAYQNEAKYGNSKAFKRLSQYYLEKDEKLAERYKIAYESAKKFYK